MESAIRIPHPQVPLPALATAGVVAATLAAAIATWTALPGSDAGGAVVRSHPVAHARPAAGTSMAGMKMPGMKMPAASR